MYSYGRDEWEDLEGAVRYALDHGARRIVLAGYSMGGAISLAFMRHSALANRIGALILDAPMIDLVPTVAHGGFVAEEVLGAPDHEMRLSGRHLEPACRADVALLGAMRGYLAHEPLGATAVLFAGASVGEARDIARLGLLPRTRCAPMRPAA